MFGRQVFAMKKGRSVVPHGHDNMATGFLVLEGRLPRPALRPPRGSRRPLSHSPDNRSRLQTGRVLDHLRSQGQHPLVHGRERDRLHFQCPRVETNPENTKRPGRVYVDPMGEKLAGGVIKAPKISYGKVNELYG